MRTREELILSLALICLFIYSSNGQLCNQENALRLNSAGVFQSTGLSVSGRLELCSCSSSSGCRWSTINIGGIAIPWSWKNGQVACRQLAKDTSLPFTGLGNPIIHYSLPPSVVAPNSVPIHQFTFECDGTETNLTDCLTEELPFILNIHLLDVFITCFTTASSGRSLKLTGSRMSHQGVLEIYQLQSSVGRWESVCADSFGSREANVTCWSLGYENGDIASVPNRLQGNEINTTPGIAILCRESDTEIKDCLVMRENNCNTGNFATVTCRASSASQGTVRLFSIPSSSTYQRVEVLYAGRWGTVCNSSWSFNDGLVACRSLGVTNNSSVKIPTSFSSPSSIRPIWATGYMCSGSESTLSSCGISYPYGYTPNCTHTYDAALTCNHTPGNSSEGWPAEVISAVVFSAALLLFILITFTFIFAKDLQKKIAKRNLDQCHEMQNIDTAVTSQRNEDHQRNEESDLQRAPPPTYDESVALQLQSVPPPSYEEQAEETLPCTEPNPTSPPPPIPTEEPPPYS